MVFVSVTTSSQPLLLLKAEGLIGDKQFIAILSEHYKGKILCKKKPEKNLLPLILYLHPYIVRQQACIKQGLTFQSLLLLCNLLLLPGY
jgi:hypothetical protein